MRISGGLVIRHESHQGQAGGRSGISALPVIGKNLTFIAGYSKILNNFQTWLPVNAKNPTTARAGDCLWQRQAEGVGRHLARGAGPGGCADLTVKPLTGSRTDYLTLFTTCH
jgi:hypothetical protein